MAETFVAEIQAQGRLVVPVLIRELQKIHEGDKVRVSIERIPDETEKAADKFNQSMKSLRKKI